MKKLWEDFKKFIKRGNVVDMAVGVAVASAFTAIVTAFTKGFISPLIALLSGHSDMSEMKWVVKEAVLDADGVTVLEAEVAILWGSFLQAIINFLIVAIALFIVMRVATAVRTRAEKLSTNVKNRFTDADEKRAAEEAKAKAEAEEAARIEAEKAAEAQRLAEEEAAKEKARIEREEALLTEMRDLLKEIKNK